MHGNMNPYHILPTGLSVVHEPQGVETLADIIFVHGLQGHPYRTWACKANEYPEHPAMESTEAAPAQGSKQTRRVKLKSFVRTMMKSEPRADLSREDPVKQVFWPADFLTRSKSCSNCRILTWGYESGVASKGGKPVNKNSIFSHAKDLVYALQRKKVRGRPIVFVAHSLGGILVKEALAICDASDEVDLQVIVTFTSAVMFLGTPHRGGGEYANVGDLVRRVASVCMLDTNPSLLDSLGLRNADMERIQDSFSRLWRKYRFKVKTFQEGVPLTGVHIPGTFLNKKVVPAHSSLLGDDREHAETLQANHMNMCRFPYKNHPNYIKVGGELKRICHSIRDMNNEDKHRLEVESPEFKGLRKSLAFPEMDFRFQTVSAPWESTCLWIKQSKEYRAWSEGRGVLWIKGNPGSGKSTIMKHLLMEVLRERPTKIVASFFCNARGTHLESSISGLLRSLSFQLLPHFPKHSGRLQQKYRDKTDQGFEIEYHDEELKDFLRLIFCTSHTNLTTACLFLDGLDECKEGREVVYFFTKLAESAQSVGNQLSICVSSQKTLMAAVPKCLEIIVDINNTPDIARYVHEKLRCVSAESSGDARLWSVLERKLVNQASGIFLWVVLIVDDVLRDWEKGHSIPYLLGKVRYLPQNLGHLFKRLLRTTNPDRAIRLFLWMVYSGRPLHLSEFSQILGFVYNPSTKIIRNWNLDPDFTENEQLLEKRITTLSRGLVEVKPYETPNDCSHSIMDSASCAAGAGSFSTKKIVQFVHDSVREYFFCGEGFLILDPIRGLKYMDTGHLFIMKCCIMYAAYSQEMKPFMDTVRKSKGLRSRRVETQPRGTEIEFAEYNGEAYVQRSSVVAKFNNNRETQRRDNPYGLRQERSKSIVSFASSAGSSAGSRAGSGPGSGDDNKKSSSLDRESAERIGEDLLGSQRASGSYADTFALGSAMLSKLSLMVADELQDNCNTEELVSNWISSLDAAVQIGEHHPDIPRGTGGMEKLHAEARQRLLTSSEVSNSKIEIDLKKDEIVEPESWHREEPSSIPRQQYMTDETGSCSSVSLTSIQTRPLDRLPSLYSYVVEMFDYHALSAEAAKSDVQPIINSFLRHGVWQQWVRIREDIDSGTTLLYYAAQRNLLSWARRILDIHPWMANMAGGRLRYPLIIATNQGHSDMVSLLLSTSDPIILESLYWQQDRSGRNFLHHSTLPKNGVIMNKALSETGIAARVECVNAGDRNGNTPLHIAAFQGDLVGMEKFIEYGADVNAVNVEGLTPLHLAVIRRRLDRNIVSALLAAGASAYACDEKGFTPLDLLNESNRGELISILVGPEKGEELAGISTRRLLSDYSPISNPTKYKHNGLTFCYADENFR